MDEAEDRRGTAAVDDELARARGVAQIDGSLAKKVKKRKMSKFDKDRTLSGVVGISTEDRFAPVDIRRIRIASETRRPALPKTPSIEPRLVPSEPPQLPTRDCRLALLRSVPAPGLIADEMPRPRAPPPPHVRMWSCRPVQSKIVCLISG